MLSTKTNPTSAVKAPDVEDLRAALQRSLGSSFEEIWEAVCRASATNPDTSRLGGEDLDRLLSSVAAHSPICRVVAMSWRIRSTSARKLRQLGR